MSAVEEMCGCSGTMMARATRTNQGACGGGGGGGGEKSSFHLRQGAERSRPQEFCLFSVADPPPT